MVVQPSVEGLGDRLGTLLFQLPPLPGNAFGTPGRFAEKLHRFLEDLPKSLPPGAFYAVELRTPALLTDIYLDALKDVGAAHCYNAWPGMPPLADQLTRIPLDHGPAVVVRWMLQRGLTYQQAADRFEPFTELAAPDPGTRDSVATLLLDAICIERDAFVIINNKAEGSSPWSIRSLAERSRDLGAGE